MNMSYEDIVESWEKIMSIGDAPIGEYWGCSVTTKLAKETLDIVKSQNHRIQELTAENFKMVVEVKNLRNDVVHEVAKRLKEFTKNDLMIKAFIDKAIDNIVKEMEEL